MKRKRQRPNRYYHFDSAHDDFVVSTKLVEDPRGGPLIPVVIIFVVKKRDGNC